MRRDCPRDAARLNVVSPVEDDDTGIWPISRGGNRFWFVAEVPGYFYRHSGADSILLFFEPVERLALLMFDWS